MQQLSEMSVYKENTLNTFKIEKAHRNIDNRYFYGIIDLPKW